MKHFSGFPVSSGIAIGHAFLLKGEDFDIKRVSVSDKELEEQIEIFNKAVKKAERQLLVLKEKVKNEIGIDESTIFDAHILLLKDPNLIEKSIAKARDEHVSIDYAFSEVMNDLRAIFEKMSDQYLRERSNDIIDAGRRILRNYYGEKRETGIKGNNNDIIVIANNIAPSSMAELNKKKIKGIITEVGGATSHTAIMARSLDVPAIVGVSDILKEVRPDQLIILDGNKGEIIIDPDAETIKKYQTERRKYVNYVKSLDLLRNEEAITKDGKKIKLELNIEFVNEADFVNSYGADGIGLFRTEYLFMKSILPTEDEQFEIYRYISQVVYPKELVIRTADLGGDKFVSHFNLPQEMNPFLGFRGIRLCLEYKDFFKTQLKAILRASKLKNIKIMFPMISGLEELIEAKKILEEAKDELRETGVEFDEEIKVGIMVEVPAAALISDVLADEVDFFSIGTNDLIQYTLAVDRVNEKISYLYNPLHPAVLRFLKMIINNGHNKQIPVAMCGQMAGTPEYTMLLLGMDLDIFSVAPNNLLLIKKIISSVEYSKCKEIVSESIHNSDVASLKEYFEGYNHKMLKNVLYNYF